MAEDLVDGVNADVIPFGSSAGELSRRIEACLDRRRWDEYQNPRRQDIRDFSAQAAELSDFMSSVVQ